MRSLIATLCLLVGTAHAFTPESGNWWNPDEPGRGFTIEIQDDFLFMTFYAYDNDGHPAWYTAQGFMTGNDFFQGEMIRFRNGQCLTCSHRPNQQVPGVAFPMSLEFTSEITAIMDWPGGVINIQRLNFILGDYRDQAMRGEWQTTIDFLTDPAVEYPFYGDVLVVDTLELIDGSRAYSGCRAEDATSARCTAWARNNQELVGFKQTGSGNAHVIVVENSATTFLTYFVEVGTSQFDGFARVYTRGTNPSGPLYPVRGHRTASWRFVRTCAAGNCSGPSSTPDGVKRSIAEGRGMLSIPELGSAAGLSAEQAASASRMNIDAMLEIEATLISELEARIAAREAVLD